MGGAMYSKRAGEHQNRVRGFAKGPAVLGAPEWGAKRCKGAGEHRERVRGFAQRPGVLGAPGSGVQDIAKKLGST